MYIVVNYTQLPQSGLQQGTNVCRYNSSIHREELVAMYEQIFCEIKCIEGMLLERYFDVTYGPCNERPQSFPKCLSVSKIAG